MSFNNRESLAAVCSAPLTPEGAACLFGYFGEIRHLHFDLSPSGARTLWVCYTTRAHASRALSALDGSTVGGSPLEVHRAPAFIRRLRSSARRSDSSSDSSDSSDSDSAPHRHRHRRRH